MSRWPHGRSDAHEVMHAYRRARPAPNRNLIELHQRTWPFDPVFVGYAVDLLARAKPPLARVSASYLERKLGIDYQAAGLLIDVLARTGLCEKSKRYTITHLEWPPPPDADASSPSSSPPPLPPSLAAGGDVSFEPERPPRFLNPRSKP